MREKPSGIITLTTDFGIIDPYVGIMKGVILAANPAANIVDLTHQVTPHDIPGAARIIESSFSCFPSGTIHVVVVDPGVGGSRRMLCLESGGHIFVAPDNGVLSRVVENAHHVSGVWVENRAWFLHPVSQTFHGRDIFAPVAARLSTGRDMTDLGPALDPESIVFLPPDLPESTASGGISGRVIRVDAFGNLITNISADVIRDAFGDGSEKHVVTRIAGREINGISETYNAAKRLAPVVLFGSNGFLEISVNLGSAADVLKAGVGENIFVDGVRGQVCS